MREKVLAALKSALVQLAAVLESMERKQSMQTPAPQQPTPTQPAQNAVQPASPKGSPTRVAQVCNLIQQYEGYIPPGGRDGMGNVYASGSPAYVNRNPGNIRCSGSKEEWPSLAIGCSLGGFCIFKTFEDGYSTLENNITAICLGNPSAENPYQLAARRRGLKNCSQLTLREFFEIRDPATDSNNPDKYAQFVGAGLGVDIDVTVMADLLL